MSPANFPTEGRIQFFDGLFREHQRALYAYLFGQTNNREGAEDLLQQVFVRVWRHIEEAIMMPSPKVKPWLFAIARNLATDQRRRAAARVQTVTTEAGSFATGRKGPDEQLEQQDALARLDRAIKNLPEDMRIAFTMSVLGDMTSEETARALGKPAGTVRYWVSEARKRIAREVER